MEGPSRRQILAGAAGLSALGLVGSAAAAPIRTMKPKALKKGDLIGLFAPAGNIESEDELQKAVSKIESLGFRVKVGANVMRQNGYLAGSDQERADDVNAMFADPEVDGMIAVRGGYGVTRMLHLLDYDLVKRNPKFVCGYSDLTALLNGLFRKTGLVTFHGPVGTSSWTDFDIENFMKVATGFGDEWLMPTSDAVPFPRAQTFVPGTSTGRLIGGNLSLIASMVGTPYFPPAEDSILFIEDLDEDVYRLDRMLTQIWSSGAFSKLKGFVIGSLKLPNQKEGEPARTDDEMIAMLAERCKLFGVPAFSGASVGHISKKLTLPIGCRARIDAEARTITLLESPVNP